MHCRAARAASLGSHLRTPRSRARRARRRATRRRELLRYVGLAASPTRTRSDLPYGDQRRLEIARALTIEPKLLLLDEPAAGMNPPEKADFTTFIRKLRDERS